MSLFSCKQVELFKQFFILEYDVTGAFLVEGQEEILRLDITGVTPFEIARNRSGNIILGVDIGVSTISDIVKSFRHVSKGVDSLIVSQAPFGFSCPSP